MAKRNEGSTQEHESETGEDFENEAADEALVREGEAELEGEESDSEDEEQSEDEDEDEDSDEEDEDFDDEEDQDDDEEEEEEDDEDEEEELKETSGKFKWSSIKAKLGKVGEELERSFSESQKTTNKALREKSEVERSFGEFQQQVQTDLQRFSQMDHLYTTNQEVHHAINKALGIAPNGQNPNPAQGFQLPPEIAENDPLAQHFVPVIRNLEAKIHQLLNHHQTRQVQESRAQKVETFRQGVISAGQAFRQILNREPSDDELTAVAEKMRTSGNFNGAELIPVLFLEEIKKGARREIQKVRKDKRNLPKSSKTGVRVSKTPKKLSRQEIMEEEWERHMGK